MYLHGNKIELKINEYNKPVDFLNVYCYQLKENGFFLYMYLSKRLQSKYMNNTKHLTYTSDYVK